MDMLRPTWAMTITQGRETRCRYAPPEVSQCFREAGLLGSTTEDVVRWWDERASLFRAARNAHLVNIGRTGERLSLALELARNGVEARWTSLDYNDSGYDLLSRISRDDGRPLAIEVKTSSQPWKTALFYVSRHEWEVLSGQDAAVIHLWNIARRPYQHAVVAIDKLSQHIALDQGDGHWETLACPLCAWDPVD